MKCKRGLFLIFLLLILVLTPISVLAAILEINMTIEPVAPVIIKELSNHALFNVTIKNNAELTDYYTFETLLNYRLVPLTSSPITIEGNSEKNFLLKVFFSKDAREEHSSRKQFPYYIKSNFLEDYDSKLHIRIVQLKDAVSINLPETIKINDKTIILEIENKEDANFEISLELESEILNKEITAILEPKEKKEVTIEISKEEIWKEAGEYGVEIRLAAGDYKIILERNITLEETNDIQTDESAIDLIFYKQESVKKTNIGNTLQQTEVIIKLSPFVKTFTSFNIRPDSEERVEDIILYKWKKELKIGESLEIKAKTNFLLPIIVILVMALGFFLYNQRKKYGIQVIKKIVKVKTKSGDFATKIILRLSNKGSIVKNIKLIDSLPLITKLHERFGVEKPDKITQNKLEWDIDKLEKGQKRIYSYVIYSKVKLLGRLTLPEAEALYERKGKLKRVRSNRVHILI